MYWTMISNVTAKQRNSSVGRLTAWQLHSLNFFDTSVDSCRGNGLSVVRQTYQVRNVSCLMPISQPSI